MNSGKRNTPGMPCKIDAMDNVFVDNLLSKTTDSTTKETGLNLTQLLEASTLKDPEYPYGARILWGRPYDTITAWEEVACWGIELFGLPGNRYITEININDMTWWFASADDRLLFLLRNGLAQCIELELSV